MRYLRDLRKTLPNSPPSPIWKSKDSARLSVADTFGNAWVVPPADSPTPTPVPPECAKSQHASISFRWSVSTNATSIPVPLALPVRPLRTRTLVTRLAELKQRGIEVPARESTFERDAFAPSIQRPSRPRIGASSRRNTYASSNIGPWKATDGQVPPPLPSLSIPK